MGYWWIKTPKGQYVDGHKHDDVVFYRQHKFLPAWAKLEDQMRRWSPDDPAVEDMGPLPQPRQVCVWFHDESTFYANDCCKQRWVHQSEMAVPYTKGEGASLMVADFVSADYGWLCLQDGSQVARDLFKAGKARDGYYTNDEIIQQAH